MSRSYLLPQGAGVVEFAGGLITDTGRGPEQALVMFPNRRPAAALAKHLAIQRGQAIMAPRGYSIDDWIDDQAASLGMGGRRIEAADGAALIYQMHPECRLPGGKDSLSIEDFLTWGFTLFADFEELKIEGIKPKTLESVQALAKEPLPESFGRQLNNLGQWYGDFYQKLSEQGLKTRSSTYAWLARNIQRTDLSGHSLVILAGFYALSQAEQMIFLELLKRDNVALVLRDGPGMDRTIGQLGIKPEIIKTSSGNPNISYFAAGDSHGQAMAANKVINPGPGLAQTVLALPREDTVFPVIQHLLPRLGDDWNISMGYPLKRTPLYGLVQVLARAHEGRDREHYFLPYYLQLMLHPYVKNLSIDGASYPARILLHGLEEELNRGSRRLVSPDWIESDPELKKKMAKRLSGLLEQGFELDKLYAHLAWIHGLVMKPFEKVASVEDFSDKIMKIVTSIAQRSPVNQHPYADRFFYRMVEVLQDMKSSLLAGESFGNIRTYFGLLEHFAAQVKVPFSGDSYRGLQVLGFLETRNLNFSRVVMLDANEGVMPSGDGVDTILPHDLRLELKLPTHQDRELIEQYHFLNLIHGAKEVVLCYGQGEGAQRSRFMEQLVWEKEQQEKKLLPDCQRLVHFSSSFSQQPPQPIIKTPEMVDIASRLVYSSTMLDCYLHCGLRFCYRYLMRIKEKELAAVDVEASEVGTLVHEILDRFFKGKTGHDYRHSDSYFREMDGTVEEVFSEQYGPAQDGNIFLIKLQIKSRMRQLLGHHRDKLQPFRVLACEDEVSLPADLPGLGPVPLTGKLDRVDLRGGQTIIVDYKTGQGKYPSSGFLLSERRGWARQLRSVQLPFYIMLFLAKNPGIEAAGINSELLMLAEPGFDHKQLFREKDDRAARYSDYREAVATLIKEIRDPELPFGDTWNHKAECGNCPYKVMCGRQWVRDRKQ